MVTSLSRFSLESKKKKKKKKCRLGNQNQSQKSQTVLCGVCLSSETGHQTSSLQVWDFGGGLQWGFAIMAIVLLVLSCLTIAQGL